MLNRIALILQTQNLTVSAFADRIGVQRSALSHVLSGRNNPSLDFVTKILRTFPEIRSQWLLFGEGKMYDSLSDVAQAGLPGLRPVETAVLPAAETVALSGGETPVGGAASGVMAGPAESVQTEKTEGAPSVVETMRPNPGAEASVGGSAVSDREAVGIEAAGNAEPAADRGAETGGPMALPAGFEPVQTDEPRLVKVVFFYSDGHFEEYARR